MSLYPPFVPKEVKLDENEYAYIVNDVRDMYIDALEREQVHRYNLICLYYYQYEDEYNEIINKIFENHMWANFGVVDKFLTCKMCKKPILIKETIPPARRAATTYYNHTRALTMVGIGLCPHCKSNPDIFIKFIEKIMGIKISNWQKRFIDNYVLSINRIKLKERMKSNTPQGLLGTRFKCSNVDEF